MQDLTFFAEANMKIKNINQTSSKTCTCKTWLEHWKNFSGQPLPTYCSEVSCTQKPECGAHVQKNDYSTDKNWYIIPLCKDHNNKKGETIDIMGFIKLVPADVNETCGKGA